MIKNNGFSLMELMVVIVLIGIIAGFSVPNYRRSIERSHERDARNNLTVIHGSQQLYSSNNGDVFWAGSGVAAINDDVNGLGLNIIGNGMAFECGNTADVCSATRDDGSFTVTVDLNAAISAANPICSAGTCP